MTQKFPEPNKVKFIVSAIQSDYDVCKEEEKQNL